MVSTRFATAWFAAVRASGELFLLRVEGPDLWLETSNDGGDSFGEKARVDDTGEVSSYAESTPQMIVRNMHEFYGNLGRNTLIGPGMVNVDVSVNKTFQLTERSSLQFRTEMFNALNHANFAIPSQPTAFSSTGPVGSAGLITSTLTSSRQLQLVLKLMF